MADVPLFKEGLALPVPRNVITGYSISLSKIAPEMLCKWFLETVLTLTYNSSNIHVIIFGTLLNCMYVVMLIFIILYL